MKHPTYFALGVYAGLILGTVIFVVVKIIAG